MRASVAVQNQGNADGESGDLSLHQSAASSRPQAAVQGYSQTMYPSAAPLLLDLSMILGILGGGMV